MRARKRNERAARSLAAKRYRYFITHDYPGAPAGFNFKKEYPTLQRYVNEWWEETYLPVVLAGGPKYFPGHERYANG